MQHQLGNTITSRAFNRVPSVDMRKDTLACFRRQFVSVPLSRKQSMRLNSGPSFLLSSKRSLTHEFCQCLTFLES